MFRQMKRIKQQMTEERAIALLREGSNGVLSTFGDGEYPYGVPVNYVYLNNKIYLHSAMTGYKIDAIERDNKVSFCVIGQDEIVSKEYTSYFRSVILFAKARITEGEERLEGFGALVEKYSGDQTEEDKKAVIERCRKACLIALDIEHVSGKEAIELVEKQ